MNDFLLFINNLVKRFPVHVEIYYSHICDWVIRVYKQGCAEDYPDSEKDGNDAVICYVQESDMELCFAKAQIAVKEWLADNDGGY
jgi:hypothetical protein